MQIRPLTLLLALSLTLFFPACSGGGKSAGTVGRSCGSTPGENLFCLTSCNLGCSLAGCNINKISQNEPIELTFNQPVDKFSVPPHSTSILLRTATGEEPVGDWIVNDNRVTFVPGVLISGAKTFFGFRPNETYNLYMPSSDEEPDVIKSMGGDRLSTSITCTLNIGEIKDLNQAPPSAVLVVPEVTESTQLNTLIKIEFNEIIDPAIFVAITPETSPIRYTVKAAEIDANKRVVCRSASEAIILPGLPRMTIDPVRGISIVTFKPKENLPGKKCIEILVTSQVKDLAGVVAKPHVMSFTTKDVGVQSFSNKEDFTSSKFLDKELSAGTWGNGVLTFSPIGGSGRHGVFDPTLGKDISDPKVKVAVYEWDLSKPGGIKIPKTHTTSGKDEFVTDGRFEFQKMDVPDGVEVHFIGSIPARIWVRGAVRIGGLIASNGESLPVSGRPGSELALKRKAALKGEVGGRGGAMGGRGGDGGDQAGMAIINAGGFGVGTEYEIDFVGTTNWVAIGAASNTVGITFKATGRGAGTGRGRTGPIVQADGFVNGNRYRIQSVGTTDFKKIGASANTVGVEFTATGRGTGTGIARHLDFDGQAGGIVKLYQKSSTERHFYEGRFSASGGKPSELYPGAGFNNAIKFSYFNVIAQHANRGGSGGAFTGDGGVGWIRWTGTNSANAKYLPTGTTPGGKKGAFDSSFPNYTNGYTHQDHFLVGGSGGAGGGSAPGGAIKSVAPDRWKAGRAGGGGGGAIGFRVGGEMVLLASGRLLCLGGSAPQDFANFSLRGMMTPGGAGSGGSLFLQVNQATRNVGLISVKGGAGGRTFGGSDQVYGGMEAYGGDGSNGIIHFETTQDPTSYKVGSTVPAKPPVSRIDPNDTDSEVAIRSLWYPASLLFPPEFKRYEIEAIIGGQPVTYSDDPKVGTLATVGMPVRFAVQGAKLEVDATGALAPKPNTSIKPFRKYVGPFSTSEPTLFDDGATGYRFELTLDRALGKTVVIKSITVFWDL
jgi:hypothetical protein